MQVLSSKLNSRIANFFKINFFGNALDPQKFLWNMCALWKKKELDYGVLN